MNLTNAIRKALKDAGAPLTLDELIEQLPEGAERGTVVARCRTLKHAGEISSSVEDGKVAYAWAGGQRQSDRPQTLTDRIREILASATQPMTAAAVCQALPDDKDESIQALLSQRARAGDFATVSAGGRKLAYCLAGGGVSMTVNVGNVTTQAPAPAAATPAPPPVPARPAAKASPLAPAQPDLLARLDDAVAIAKAARDAYVESVVNQDVYVWLQAAVRTARAARDAFTAGAK